MYLENILVAVVVLFAVVAAIVLFPKMSLFLVGVWLILSILELAKLRREGREFKKEVEAVRSEFPNASKIQLESIAKKMRHGFKIDEFLLEGGQLTHTHLGITTYLRSKNRWANEPVSSDPAAIYEPQKIKVRDHVAGLGLSEEDIHELAVMVYFNWDFHWTRIDGKVARIMMGRRGERRTLVFNISDTCDDC